MDWFSDRVFLRGWVRMLRGRALTAPQSKRIRAAVVASPFAAPPLLPVRADVTPRVAREVFRRGGAIWARKATRCEREIGAAMLADAGGGLRAALPSVASKPYGSSGVRLDVLLFVQERGPVTYADLSAHFDFLSNDYLRRVIGYLRAERYFQISKERGQEIIAITDLGRHVIRKSLAVKGAA